VNNKICDIMSYLVDDNVSILFVSETWLTSANNEITAAIKAQGYNIIHKTRSCTATGKTRGGGVGIIHKISINVTQTFVKHGDTFESVCAKLKSSNGDNVFCCSIYRPPNVSAELFFTEFDEFLSSVFIKFDKIVIAGDINFHLENPKSTNTIKFNELIGSYGLKQMLEEITHKAGHTLDVVICSHKLVDETSVSVNNVIASVFPTCDHYPCAFNLNDKIISGANEEKTITFRNIKNIDAALFHTNLQNSLDSNSTSPTFEEAINQFNSSCLSVINNHAPLLTKTIKDRKSAPWFDGEYKCQRILRRKAQKRWKRTQLPEDKSTYVKLRDHCSKLAAKKKIEYHQNEFKKRNYSPKSLFKFVDTFMDRDQDLVLPPGKLVETVENFNHFFEEKVDIIRSKFTKPTAYNNNRKSPEATFQGPCLHDFALATIDEIATILKESQFKCSSLDPLPASLMKDNLDTLLPHLCEIVNLSLSTGNIDGVKLAHITPLIKGSGLDHAELKNYRPISNLSFVGKLIERVVLARLNTHLDEHGLNIPTQSGYKKRHSTETLLLRVVNDLLIASDEKSATVVMLLDLSAAFDTVDHQKLLTILETEIGIKGTALDWFKSFLSGRCQRVKIGDHESQEIIIRFGVPQGSVLGPVLFNLYIRSLYSSVTNLKFNIHGYADDHQLYKNFTIAEEYSTMVIDVRECFDQVSEWMNRHFLQLNASKTEIIVFGSPSVLSELSINGVFLKHDACVRLSPVVKNLGFRLDSALTFKHQVSKLKSTCFTTLRNINKMKTILTTKQLQILVQAVVVSLLDYCNGLYFECSQSLINQLQLIQNKACRVIFGLKNKDSVEEKMKSMHWLKVEQRIEFKIILLVYKSLNELAPLYLTELFSHYIASSSNRSSKILIPRQYMQCTRAFQTAGPRLWNQLPADIRDCHTIGIFKQKLKTHLFRKSYIC
jgi:hypothetical protein